MDYPPVQAQHLQQIHQVNKLFLGLLGSAKAERELAGVSVQARRLLTSCSEVHRDNLAALPRALFQIQLQGPTGPTSKRRGASSEAVRAFALTALLVAFNMVRESGFAARVLFAGSWTALDALARSELSDLIHYSSYAGLLTCPLLEHGPTSRLLEGDRRPVGCLPRDAMIALAQSRSPKRFASPGVMQFDGALRAAN